MEYFSTRKTFLIPSFNLEEKEQAFFDRFLTFLENSKVGDLIAKHIHNMGCGGGRPNVNYYNLLAAILVAFAFGKTSVREIEDLCGHDIRFINLMEQVRPSYSTIARYITYVIGEEENEIFALINKQICKEMGLSCIDAFIDGTKFEANSNKYKFVWKPLTFHHKLSLSFFDLVKKAKVLKGYKTEMFVSSKTVAKALNEINSREDSKEKKAYFKAFEHILMKVLEYEEKEAICGEHRNSYYKTDHDATAMCLKQDYYSGLGTNLHAAYNTQILVSNGLVLTYYVSQDRSDFKAFIPTLKKFYKLYGAYPQNVCADAGYGSFENYTFLEQNYIGSYVKHTSWQGNISGRLPDTYHVNKDKTITCIGGHVGYRCEIPHRHPKRAGSLFYKIDGCKNCLFKPYCMRLIKSNEEKEDRIFEVNPKYMLLKQKAEQNLLSKKGIELRVNRSVQVEGVFGNEKQNYSYSRVRRRGIGKVSTEMMLMFLGHNLRKLFSFYKTNKLPTYWVTPENLEPETFKKLSVKKLTKMGKRISAKLYKKQDYN